MSNYFITTNNSNPINISEENFNNICAQSEIIFKYRLLIINWLTYHDSIKLLDEFKQNGVVKLLDKFDLDNFALPNAYVGNALNAFYMFEQFCEHYFACFTNDIKQEVYDNNFEYRFVYNLRTYSTHNEMPILKVSGEYDMDNKKYFNPGFTVSKERFCGAKKLQLRVRNEVEETISEEDIDVYKYLKKVDEILFLVVTKIILNDSSEIINIYESWYSLDNLKDEPIRLDLWKDNNVEIYMTSNLYMTYMNFNKYLLNQEYCCKHTGSIFAKIETFCNTLKQILHIEK